MALAITLHHRVAARLIEPAHRRYYTTHEVDHSLRCRSVLRAKSSLETEQLRLGQQRREGIVHLVLNAGHQLPKLGHASERVSVAYPV